VADLLRAFRGPDAGERPGGETATFAPRKLGAERASKLLSLTLGERRIPEALFVEFNFYDAVKDLATRLRRRSLALTAGNESEPKSQPYSPSVDDVGHRVNLTRIGGDGALIGRPCRSRAGVKRVRSAHAIAA
jgi:hypothetical protein